MRLPQHFIESRLFALESFEELQTALGSRLSELESTAILRLLGSNLPPATSVQTLGVILGLNPGIIWSFINRPHRQYTSFEIPKGKVVRKISAPKVGLKIIQTWLAYHWSRAINYHHHVYGFVPGRSYIDAAFVHRGASWAYSIDIKDFFGTTPRYLVAAVLGRLGYPPRSAEMLSRLTCLEERLPQGAPTSPVLSNLCFADLDGKLSSIAGKLGCVVSRYADDIVFSGKGAMPDALAEEVRQVFTMTPWLISKDKERIQPLKGRVKVHGLLITESGAKLTKGYRNKIRVYRHILRTRDNPENQLSLIGHICHSGNVDSRISRLIDQPRDNSRPELSYLSQGEDYPRATEARALIKLENPRNRSSIIDQIRRLVERARGRN